MTTDESALDPTEGRKTYRVSFLGLEGRILRTKLIMAGDDTEALARATELLDGRAITLWDGARLVERLDPPWTAND